MKQYDKITRNIFIQAVILILLIYGSVFLLSKSIERKIENSGGVKQIIISIGKDVKDILDQIEE